MAERVHGGVDARELAELGLQPDEVVDFSVNINPYGPCPALIAALREVRLDRYPDPHARAARSAWARALGRELEELIVGHGATDLFWAIARALLRPGQRVVIAEPTFSEFAVAAEAAQAEIERVWAPPEADYHLDFDALERRARGARALYLCAPNNPTGEHLAVERVARLACALPETSLVLDQSFLALSEQAHELHVRLPDNVLCVRSLTKELACPGLRIGLCVAHPTLIRMLEAARPTWATSSLALAALEVGAGEASFVRASFQRLREDREAVRALLLGHGLTPVASATTYQLVGVPRSLRSRTATPQPGQASARVLRGALLRAGVLVRDCASFGLPEHVRVAALPARERTRLAAALARVLDS